MLTQVLMVLWGKYQTPPQSEHLPCMTDEGPPSFVLERYMRIVIGRCMYQCRYRIPHSGAGGRMNHGSGARIHVGVHAPKSGGAARPATSH